MGEQYGSETIEVDGVSYCYDPGTSAGESSKKQVKACYDEEGNKFALHIYNTASWDATNREELNQQMTILNTLGEFHGVKENTTAEQAFVVTDFVPGKELLKELQLETEDELMEAKAPKLAEIKARNRAIDSELRGLDTSSEKAKQLQAEKAALADRKKFIRVPKTPKTSADFEMMVAFNALEALEKFPGVHRDVKADNFMVDVDGSVRLIDYDESELFTEKQLKDEKRGKPAVISDRNFYGSPDYTAPEVYDAEGDRPYTRASDAYSAGMMFQREFNIIDPAIIQGLTHPDPSRRWTTQEARNKLLEQIQAMPRTDRDPAVNKFLSQKVTGEQKFANPLYTGKQEITPAPTVSERRVFNPLFKGAEAKKQNQPKPVEKLDVRQRRQTIRSKAETKADRRQAALAKIGRLDLSATGISIENKDDGNRRPKGPRRGS